MSIFKSFKFCRPFLASFIMTAVFTMIATESRAAESILETVKATKTLRVATIAANPPWESLQPDGSMQGYEIDVAKLLAKELGAQIQFIQTDIAGRVASLQAHKADVTIGVFTPTPERAQVVSFTEPYSMEGTQIVVRSDYYAQKVGDLNKDGVRIGVTRGSTTSKVIMAALPKASVTEFAGQADLLAAISSQQVDAFSANNGLAESYVKQSNGKLRAIEPILQEEDVAIGAPKGDDKWLEFLNQFVKKINNNGENYAAYKKWLTGNPPAFVHPAAQ